MTVEQPLAGQVAVVTGGASGIGRETCRLLADRGARVVVADRDREGAAATVHDIAQQPGAPAACAATVDVSDEAEVTALMDGVVDRLGSLDVLVTCAGLLRTTGRPRTVADLDLAEWERIVAVNLTGTFLCDRAAVRHMKRARRGQVINVSSLSGLQGHAYDAAYCATKFGVIGLSEALAEEVVRYRIRVQTVLPDVVATALWEQNGILPPPDDALSAAHVGEFITYLVCLPQDVVLGEPRAREVRPRPSVTTARRSRHYRSYGGAGSSP